MNALLDLLSTAGTVLDTPGALLRTALAGRNPLPGIFDPAQRVSGRDLLEQWGALDANQEGLDWGDAAGVGMELALDPLNLLGGWGLARTLGKRAAARASNAKRAQLLEAGAMPEEVAQLTKAVDETGRPVTTYHGTPHVYDRPDMARMSPDELYGPGYYTTEDMKVASSYTDKGAQYKVDAPAFTQDVRQAFEPLDARVQELLRQRVPQRGDSLFDPRNPLHAEFDSALEQWRSLKRLTEQADLHARYPTLNELGEKGFAARTIESHPWLAKYFEEPHLNTRMQHLDVRAPFNADAILSEAERGRLWEILGRRHADDPEYLDWAKSSLFDPEFPVSGRDLYEKLAPFSPQPGDYTKPALNELLKEAGYDSITHWGGGLPGIGGSKTPHRVWISLDPDKQVYGPWVAPAQMREPRVNPLLAGLTGHNLLARNRGGY